MRANLWITGQRNAERKAPRSSVSAAAEPKAPAMASAAAAKNHQRIPRRCGARACLQATPMGSSDRNSTPRQIRLRGNVVHRLLETRPTPLRVDGLDLGFRGALINPCSKALEIASLEGGDYRGDGDSGNRRATQCRAFQIGLIKPGADMNLSR